MFRARTYNDDGIVKEKRVKPRQLITARIYIYIPKDAITHRRPVSNLFPPQSTSIARWETSSDSPNASSFLSLSLFPRDDFFRFLRIASLCTRERARAQKNYTPFHCKRQMFSENTTQKLSCYWIFSANFPRRRTYARMPPWSWWQKSLRTLSNTHIICFVPDAILREID